MFFRGVMTSGGAVNHYVSGVMASMLHKNLEDEYLDKVIKIYKVRYIISISLIPLCSKNISLKIMIII